MTHNREKINYDRPDVITERHVTNRKIGGKIHHQVLLYERPEPQRNSHTIDRRARPYCLLIA
jgi:hypothetical protein